VYLEPEASPAVSISSDGHTDSPEESDSEFDSALDPDVDMRMEADVGAPDGVELDGDVDMEREADDEVEEYKQEEDEEEEQDGDDGKEPQTIAQGEMVNTSADDVDTMVDDQPIVLPEQGQEIRKNTTRPKPPAPAPRPQTPEPRPPPQTLEAHPLSGLEQLGLVTPQKPRPALPTLREVEVAGNTSDVDVNQQLQIESAVGDSHSDVPLPDVPLPEVHPDGSVGEE
jgi:hypothetical protein